MKPPLDVYLNSRRVGQLRRRASGAIDFTYDPTWLDWVHAVPISLSMPLREDRYAGAAVLAVLDNLLPDSHAVRRLIADRVRASGHNDYDLLAAIGRDCVGALQFLPEGADPGLAGVVEGSPVSDAEIAHMIANLPSIPLGLEQGQEFRISLAGAQEKTALLRWRDQWHVPHRTTATTHILKPQIGVLANGIDLSRSVENELLTSRLTAALGVRTASAEMVDFEGRRVLVVERFDRSWTTDGRLLRLPQEDLCQALSVFSSQKYEADGGPGPGAIMDLLLAADDPRSDRHTFFKAQFVFWLLAATDGHAKNFSVFLLPRGRFRLTPMYDVVSMQPAHDAQQISRNQMKMAMAIGVNRHYTVNTILPRHFLQLAASCGLGEAGARDVFVEVLDSADMAITRVMSSLPSDFPPQLCESIVGGLRRRMRTVEGMRAE